MSTKYKHIQIKNNDGFQKKKSHKIQDEYTPSNLATSKMKEKLRNSHLDKNKKKNNKLFLIEDVDEDDGPNTVRYNSHAKRKVSKNKDLEKPKKLKSTMIEKESQSKKKFKSNMCKSSKTLIRNTFKFEKAKKMKMMQNYDEEEDNDNEINIKPKKMKSKKRGDKKDEIKHKKTNTSISNTTTIKKKFTKNERSVTKIVGFEPKAIHRKTKSSVKEKNTTTKIKKNNKKENEDNNEEKKEKSQKKKKRLAGNSVDKANKRKIENKPVTKTKSLMTEKNRKKKNYESSSSSSSSSSSGSGSDSDSSSSEKNDSKNNKKDKDNKKKKSESSSNKSSITPTPSSSVSNSDNSDEEKEKEKEKDKEKENDENKKNLIKSKTNLDKQSLNIEVQNKKEENKENTEEKNKKEEEILNIVPKIESFRPASTEKRKGSIILGNTYLRRRSMDNPFTRERLELLVNQMTLKQNGGNTLFLRNYENGPSYAKEITIITKDNTQTLKKNIKINECTKAGCSGPGIVKTNQDAYFVKDNFLKNPDYFFIGVCDGHGEQGQLVSNYVANKLPTYITDLSNENIINAFKKVNKEIYANSKMDSNMSGTTVVSIIMTPNNIICVNLGDSRAALFKYDSGIYYCKNLSRDHKPCEADETKRIINSGGRVKKCYDEDHKRFIGPDRVWMKNREEPGLAMTRSLGDKIAHDIGVIDEPEFKTFTYDGSEKFIIIASDGLWEYVSGDQCISIVKPFYEEGLDSKEAAFALTKEAFRRWKRKEVAIDDITVVVIFFD